MAEITQKIRTAIAGFAKINNQEIKRELILAIDELDAHLNRLEYDPSSEVEKRTELLNEAIQTSVELFKDDKTDIPVSKESDKDFEVIGEDDESKDFEL